MFPACALANAISSLTDFTGSDGCTTTRNGPSPIMVMPARSFSGSNGSLAAVAALVV